eukprot:CAMPEP_0194288270 /NCGR_PEP_ID=MMETSP0169-20130528/36469_1 /TAXON_ID=218684 /ORGANISM="Corethron pennatum, Strain L29A3" /LENGTH=197 /DNA_ID=CAMNT_0039035223 /DNA_START=50 /DNA_END=643 /DNA_ORIENTATION=-
MTVYFFHMFDRRGRTLYSRTYHPEPSSSAASENSDENKLEEKEQRKLLFGILFSLKEMVGRLAPEEDKEEGEKEGGGENIKRKAVLNSIRTGPTTLHSLETLHGHRLVMYTDSASYLKASSSGSGLPTSSSNPVHTVLRSIYADHWVECVVRSPMYRPGAVLGTSDDGGLDGIFDVRKRTDFEKRLDRFIMSLPYYR